MGAISIAFDIIIVGALALPWVLLVIHLFFSNDESSLRTLLAWVSKQNQPAIAGALLFAMTYSLGSAVSRIAQDFFDDDDLHIRVSNYLLRMGVSESSIRSDVYCAIPKKLTADPQTSDPKADSAPAEKREPFRNKDAVCEFAAKWVIPRDGSVSADWIDELEERTGDIFRLKEATVLLEGTDKIEVLRQFHDQIMVLRGAAFSGMLAFSFCLFWWSAQFQSVLRWLVLVIYVFPGAVATWNHFTDHPHSPPYMEFTLLALAAASARLLWQTRQKSRRVPGGPAAASGRGGIRLSYVALSLFLTAVAFLGWWATQVLYDEEVIYSYQALSSDLPQATTPNPK